MGVVLALVSWLILALQLLYIAVNDLRVWKITNLSNLVLALSYFAHVAAAGQWSELVWHLATAVAGFLVLLFPYQRNWLGGGDFKFLVAALLWLGPLRLFAFSVALFGALLVYFVLMKLGVAPSESVDGRNRIAFGPAGAFALAAALLAA